ncbi:hypothetical protein HZF08_34665 [Paenibacillus sp. CGMCC 1.16610]|uniref:Uncharacterized protein n=1 Tax=Paenibacillus anseongense TaxID=2682845 RepID=A0ABW9U7Y4_9BACL|nr:hypothetical protein [Paenibacillus sp. CGMCC 1.16610]MVQ33915.1 hypothetical protein [Paenibacillus anseongense]
MSKYKYSLCRGCAYGVVTTYYQSGSLLASLPLSCVDHSSYLPDPIHFLPINWIFTLSVNNKFQ